MRKCKTRLGAWIRVRIGFIRRPVRLYHLMIDGKKLLVVVKYNIRGVEWIERYEVVSALDGQLNPVEKKFTVPIRV